MPRVRRRLERFLLHFGIGLGVWFAIVFLDPFGSYSFVTSKAVKIYAQMKAPFYGSKGESSRDNIAVVLFTSENGNAYAKFPLTADEYADILAGILEHQPRAVFLDIKFKKLHKDEPDFLDKVLLSMQKKADPDASALPVPLIFGMGRVEDDTDPISKAVEQQVRSLVHVYHAPTWHTDDSDLYQLQRSERSSSGVTIHYSAALQLYMLSRCSTESCPAIDPGLFRRDLAIQWGIEPPESYRGDLECVRGGHDLTGKIGHSALMTLSGAFPGIAAMFNTFSTTQPCPYHEWLDTATVKATSDRDWQIADKYIKGRIILFGQDDGVEDLHDTPFGRAPGVFIHAMALDNLLTYGAGYYKTLGNVEYVNIPEYRFLSLCLWLIISVFLSVMYALHDLLGESFPWIGGHSARECPEMAGPRFRSLWGCVLGGLLLPAALETVPSVVTVMFLALLDFKLHWRFSELMIFAILVPLHLGISRRIHKVCFGWEET